MSSPYLGQAVDQWSSITDKLIAAHPLKPDEIVKIVLKSWNDIFNSSIGSFYIGKDIFPTPQIISFLLHELVAHNLGVTYPGTYKVGTLKGEKDIHCINDYNFSVEIKASSHKSQIFANRSYAQPQVGTGSSNKNGYYITINFEKFNLVTKKLPKITLIRFGYLEHSDWAAQTAATGQKASLSGNVYRYKLKQIYPKLK